VALTPATLRRSQRTTARKAAAPVEEEVEEGQEGRRNRRDRHDALPPDAGEVGNEAGGEDGGAGRLEEQLEAAACDVQSQKSKGGDFVIEKPEKVKAAEHDKLLRKFKHKDVLPEKTVLKPNYYRYLLRGQNGKAKGMVEKLQETWRELEPLQSRKTDMEAKVGSLEVALLAAIAGNSNELVSAVDEMKVEMPAARKEGENQTIEQIFEKLVRLEKLVSLLIMRTEEMPSCTKQGMASSEQISNAKELKATKTILGNLVNLAHPDKGTSLANWILDSGASKHVTGTLSEFASYNPFAPMQKETIQTADGTAQPIKGVGTVQCTPSITLLSVLYVLSFLVNLVSLSVLVDHMDCRVSLDRENCLIEDRRDYTSCTALTVAMGENEAKVILEHCRLGHLSFDTMAKVFPEIMSQVDKRKLVCDACEYGKHTRSVYVSKGLRSISPFMLIHSDVWTCPVISISGMKYFVTFIDCYSRMTWIYLMKQKNEVLKCFRDFCSLIGNQFDARVKVLRTDNGTEYVNNEFESFLSAQGILHQTTCLDTPPQNGVAERKNRHILEVARSLMYTMNVPKFLWSEAVMTAVYLINRTPSRLLGWKTPYEMLRGVNEFIVPPKVFGCTCFVRDHRPSVGKLDPRAVKCIFVGYSSSQKGYKCWCPTERRLFISMDVTFRESEPYYGEKTDLSSLFELDDLSINQDD